MKVAVLVVSRNRPDLVESMAGWLKRNMTIDHDLFVVEAGTEPENLTEYTTAAYDDADFRGKCFAHNVALEHAREAGKEGTPYDYYWVLMNDVVFDEGVDAARILIDQMEKDPRLAILSPACKDGMYPSSERRPGGGWRPVTTCDYLGFMMRAEAVETVGFLNPDFKYCWGAIHELSFLLYKSGWIVGYSDAVEFEHLGGSTYGVKGTNTISREEYQVRAKRFALAYFTSVYGPGWAQVFWDAARHHGIEIDTYAEHQRIWAEAFTPEEVHALLQPALAPAAELATAAVLQPRPTSKAMHDQDARSNATSRHRLHLGCGFDRREGWVNVDVNPDVEPDLVADVTDLHMLEDGSCDTIESCHLFEHLTFTQATRALREWRRLLAPGGQLQLELPNFEACVRLIGETIDGYDLGMYSIFGYPPDVDSQGAPQLHKWGWTPTTLANAMREAGFGHVEEQPVTQTWRKATAFDRDMRVVGTVTAGVRADAPAATDTSPAIEATAVLAWPDYRSDTELDRFLMTYGPTLAARDDVVLFLRVDPDHDPDRAAVVAAIEASYARSLGADCGLNVQLLEGPIAPLEWREVGRNVACRIKPARETAPRDQARLAPTVVVEDDATLRTALDIVHREAATAPDAEPAPSDRLAAV